MAKLVAKTYGDALFELALEENKLDAVADDVQVIATAFAENPELSKLMNHPKVEKLEKCKVMENILKDRVADEIAGFFDIIIKKDRYRDLPDILEYFLDKVKEHKNIGTAFVTTPTALSEEQKSKVEARLLETTGYEKTDVNYSEDASLIGGMVIRIGDRVVDSSIKTKIYELTKDLTKIQLTV